MLDANKHNDMLNMKDDSREMTVFLILLVGAREKCLKYHEDQYESFVCPAR